MNDFQLTAEQAAKGWTEELYIEYQQVMAHLYNIAMDEKNTLLELLVEEALENLDTLEPFVFRNRYKDCFDLHEEVILRSEK